MEFVVVFSVMAAALVIGPWLGGVVDRLVDRTAPTLGYRCVHCKTEAGLRSLVSVLHWFQSCRKCGQSFGRRYVIVDGLTVICWAVLAARFEASLQLLPYLALGAVLVVLSVVDAETHLLPNVIVWPSIVVGFIAVIAFSQLADESRLVPAVVGACIFGGFLGISHVAYPPGLGRGDVKLALLLGLFIGWAAPSTLDAIRLVLYASLLAFVGGALVGIAINVAAGKGRAEIPFGPALSLASVVVIASSTALASI